MGMKTYTSARTNPIAFVREAYHLYRMKSADIPGQVRGTIEYMQRCEARIAQETGMRLEGQKMLVIGPGQTPREMAYLGLRNEVIGIDLDVIPQQLSFSTYMSMLRQNGWMRTLKTLARKSLGIDAQFTRELKKQLGISVLPRTSFQQMDAAKMTFPDASLDFVYSFSVFEHLPDPGAVLDGVVRVLRPGGVCYISLHLYSSENGCHDLRIFCDDREHIPYWAHLRPSYESLVQPNAYLNKIRIAEWKQLFESRMPGVSFAFDTHEPEKNRMLEAELEAIRRAGELTDYTDEELLSVNLMAVWQKPV
jgi:SAM-dependent methyltransferase